MKDHNFNPCAKVRNFEATFCSLAFFFHSAKNRFCLRQFVKYLNSTERGPFFLHFCVSRLITILHAHKSGVTFHVTPLFIIFLSLPLKFLSERLISGDTVIDMKLHNGKEVFYTVKNGEKQGWVITTVWTISADSCLCVMCEVKVTNTDVFLYACMYGFTILTKYDKKGFYWLANRERVQTNCSCLHKSGSISLI